MFTRSHYANLQENLQGDDVRGEGVRNGPDVFTQGVIFGACASHRAPGLLIPPAALRREKDRGGANQRYRDAQRPAAVSHPDPPVHFRVNARAIPEDGFHCCEL